MEQEEKDYDLLLRDLSARLPYRVKIQVPDDICSGYYTETVWTIDNDEPSYVNGRGIEYIKPYLFPLSSITKEMMEEPNIYGFFKYRDTIANVGHLESKNGISEEIYTYIDIESVSALLEFFHSHHIDYRGLIEKGLAIDATGLKIY